MARLREAYRAGIFPWFSPGQPVLWWSTNLRMVLPTQEFKLSVTAKTLQKSADLHQSRFQLGHQPLAPRLRTRWPETWICATFSRPTCNGMTWGAMHSFETWVMGPTGGRFVSGVNLGHVLW